MKFRYLFRFVVLQNLFLFVKCDDSLQQQLKEWFKDLGQNEILKPCQTKISSVIDKNQIFIENFPCSDEDDTSDNFFFEKGGYTKDGRLSGKGTLFIFDRIEDSKTKSHDIWKNRKRQTKLCIKYKSMFGHYPEIIHGEFVNGKLVGEARISLNGKNGIVVVNFVDGVPHGRARFIGAENRLQSITTISNGEIKGPCWLIRDPYFYFGDCNQPDLPQVLHDKTVLTGNLQDPVEKWITGNLVTEHKIENGRFLSKLDLQENENCILVPKSFEVQPDQTFQFNLEIREFFYKDIPNPSRDENLCSGKFEDTDWNQEDSIQKISIFLESIRSRYQTDPFWMFGHDSSPVEKKNKILLLSNIEKLSDFETDLNYEAVLNFNGVKEQIEFVYDGELNENGEFNHFGILNIIQKKMCFRGKCKYPSVETIKANFKSGLISGSVTIIGAPEKYYVAYGKVKEGCLHGRLVMFGAKPLYEKNEDIRMHLSIYGRLELLSFIGLYLNGKPVGTGWVGLIGGGFLMGKVDKTGKITDDDSGIFFYPGFSLAIIGKFEQNFLRKGRSSNVGRERCHQGLKIVELFEPILQDMFEFDPPSNSTPGKWPLLRDPYESATIRVGTSRVPGSGEGVFATRNIRSGELVALYAGYKYVSDEEVYLLQLACDDNPKLSDDKKQHCLTYRYSSPYGYTLDLPESCSDLTCYSATLGAKINHSFRNNAVFIALDHPRFGFIVGVVANRDIQANEEIFTFYGYQINSIGLDWYFELKDKFEKGLI